MTILYEQFLGSSPGILLELVDDSKSPYRVRTADGFEFIISADDFRRFYRQCGSPVPDMWRPFVTDRKRGLVDANKAANAVNALEPFEKIFLNFTRAREFVREFLKVYRVKGTVQDEDVKELIEKYSKSRINPEDIKSEIHRLCSLDSGALDLLADEYFLNLYTSVGQIGRPDIKSPETTLESKAGKRKPKSSQVENTARARSSMKNVDMKVEGDILTVTIDLAKEFGPSKSGKTIIIASTEGNKSVPGKDHKIGLNVYKYVQSKPKRGNRDSFKNVETNVTGSILTVKIDLSKEFGPSKSGKTIIVASTEGNQLIYGRNELIGLNVYRKVES